MTIRTVLVAHTNLNLHGGPTGLKEMMAERVVSRPASGQAQVLNIVWDPTNEEFIIEISDITQP